MKRTRSSPLTPGCRWWVYADAIVREVGWLGLSWKYDTMTTSFPPSCLSFNTSLFQHQETSRNLGQLCFWSHNPNSVFIFLKNFPEYLVWSALNKKKETFLKKMKQIIYWTLLNRCALVSPSSGMTTTCSGTSQSILEWRTFVLAPTRSGHLIYYCTTGASLTNALRHHLLWVTSVTFALFL